MTRFRENPLLKAGWDKQRQRERENKGGRGWNERINYAYEPLRVFSGAILKLYF